MSFLRLKSNFQHLNRVIWGLYKLSDEGAILGRPANREGVISDKSGKGEGRGGGYQKSCYGITCVTESLLNSEEIMDICLLPSVLNHSTVDLHDCSRF